MCPTFQFFSMHWIFSFKKSLIVDRNVDFWAMVCESYQKKSQNFHIFFKLSANITCMLATFSTTPNFVNPPKENTYTGCSKKARNIIQTKVLFRTIQNKKKGPVSGFVFGYASFNFRKKSKKKFSQAFYFP